MFRIRSPRTRRLVAPVLLSALVGVLTFGDATIATAAQVTPGQPNQGDKPTPTALETHINKTPGKPGANDKPTPSALETHINKTGAPVGQGTPSDIGKGERKDKPAGGPAPAAAPVTQTNAAGTKDESKSVTEAIAKSVKEAVAFNNALNTSQIAPQ